jgi:protein-disulfide isomerase
MKRVAHTSTSTAVLLALVLTETTPAAQSLDVSPEALRLDGAPLKGSSTGPITIVEFSDFQCPFCAKEVPVLEEILKAYPGRVRWIFKHFPLDFHRDAPLAHRAALAAGEQGRFWEMHDALFANQRALKRDDLIGAAQRLGLDIHRFAADLENARLKAIVDRDREDGARLAVNGTPTFFINGRRLVGSQPAARFRSLIEEELKVAPTGTVVGRPRGETPPAPAAAKQKRAIAVTAASGPDDAPVTILWFSDVQSPLSVQAAGLVSRLLGAYGGKIRLVFKHRPLEFHSEALLTHEALAAAGARGKFWEMHDAVLANPTAITRDKLIEYATQLGLDRAEFVAALDARRYRSVVQKDLAEANTRDVRGAPVFFIGATRIDGIQPLGVFKKAVDAALASASVLPSAR